MGFTPNRLTVTEYIQCWFSIVQKAIEESAPESAQKNINLEILTELPVPVPPLPVQETFAAVVRRHENLREQQREASRQADHLFHSLLHRAFQTDN